MTVPGITPSPVGEGRHWSFTRLSVERLLDESFGGRRGEVRTYGNLLAVTAFLYGLCAEELRPSELAVCDPEYALMIAARGAKAE